MKRQLFRLATVSAAAAAMMFAQAQTPAQAQTSKPTHNRMTKNHGPMARHRMFQQLNLTAAQKEHAQAIFTQSREAAKPVRAQLRQNRAAMTAAMKADQQTEISRLAAERGRLMGQLTAGRTAAMAKFYHELSPQQRATAERMHHQSQAHMRERTQHRAAGSNS